ncbi:MAG: ASKHA domain-containing protein [Candidatus Thorarchaeota archaeon]
MFLNNDNHIIIDFEPISRRVAMEDLGKNLYQILTDIDIKIRSECGGLGTCGKCQCIIQKGSQFLNQPTKSEIKFLRESMISEGWRLACQTCINRNLSNEIMTKESLQIKIYLPEKLLIEDFKILTAGLDKGVNFNPAIKKVYVELEKPSLTNPIADMERVTGYFENHQKDYMLNLPLEIEFEQLQKLPQILRENESKMTLTIWDHKKIIDIEPLDSVKQNFGIAFDIGTTTIVGYLINLSENKIYSVKSKLNPQTALGEDVVTRITFTKDNENGLEKLNALVIDALNEIIYKTCEEAKISSSQIYEATVVGNSVMHHLFLGISPISIGLSPYVPVVQRGLNFSAHDLRLDISKSGNVYTLPLIAGFVGADTVGVIISSEIDKEEPLTLAIDIGTNGEIIVGNKDTLITGSCAAGSALEGAHIKHGMRAAAGSIDSLKINPNTFQVKYTTIKNKKPIGICGSGLIDAVAEMLKAKVLNRNGSFNKDNFDHERLIEINGTKEFIIAFDEETPHNSHITLSQSDVRQIQMAKGAFYSANRLILEHLNNKSTTNSSAIEQVFLAGAFGNYINKENAKFIGMIPDIESKNIFQIGNAAGIGAQHCLRNKNLRDKAQLFIKNIEYIEIATKENFQIEYAKAMYFPHMDLDLFPSLTIYQDIPKR